MKHTRNEQLVVLIVGTCNEPVGIKTMVVYAFRSTTCTCHCLEIIIATKALCHDR
jgi:hypothetical protein